MVAGISRKYVRANKMASRNRCYLQHGFLRQQARTFLKIWMLLRSKQIWSHKENWNILKNTHKNNNMTVTRSYVSVFTQTAGGTRRWKVPADNMKHARYTHNNYGELPAAVLSRRGLFLEPDSSGVSRFMWSLFFWEFFLSHCWWRYLRRMLVFSVTIICSDGYSFVGRYTDGRLTQVRLPLSVWNRAKLFSL